MVKIDLRDNLNRLVYEDIQNQDHYVIQKVNDHINSDSYTDTNLNDIIYVQKGIIEKIYLSRINLDYYQMIV